MGIKTWKIFSQLQTFTSIHPSPPWHTMYPCQFDKLVQFKQREVLFVKRIRDAIAYNFQKLNVVAICLIRGLFHSAAVTVR